jgi:hypothetical protein
MSGVSSEIASKLNPEPVSESESEPEHKIKPVIIKKEVKPDQVPIKIKLKPVIISKNASSASASAASAATTASSASASTAASSVCDNIGLFYLAGKRKDNDQSNKKREEIMLMFLLNTVPEEFFHADPRWTEIKQRLDEALKKCEFNLADLITCEAKGGRLNHYDFKLVFRDGKEINLEFKHGKMPQFVSLGTPSRYLSLNYEEFHYENCLPAICRLLNLPVPNRETYMKEVHRDKPECLSKHQASYYLGAVGSSRCSGSSTDILTTKEICKITAEGIEKFISAAELDIKRLNEQLQVTQNNKLYCNWVHNDFEFNQITARDLTILEGEGSVVKTKNSFILLTESGKRMTILLRWKNGNGIAFPALQISLTEK